MAWEPADDDSMSDVSSTTDSTHPCVVTPPEAVSQHDFDILPAVRPNRPSIYPGLIGNTVAAALLGQSMASRDRGKGGGKGGGSGNDGDQQ